MSTWRMSGAEVIVKVQSQHAPSADPTAAVNDYEN